MPTEASDSPDARCLIPDAYWSSDASPYSFILATSDLNVICSVSAARWRLLVAASACAILRRSTSVVTRRSASDIVPERSTSSHGLDGGTGADAIWGNVRLRCRGWRP